MAIVRGVDISRFQDPSGTADTDLPDWAKVFADGYKFGLCRMSIGKNTSDEDGRQNLKNMLGAMPVSGAYGVVGTAEPVQDGAKFFLNEVAAVVDPKQVLIMLDAEDFSDGSHPDIVQVDKYATQIHSELGRWPIAYIPGWWMNKYGYSAAARGLAECPWAQSHYYPAPWTDSLLQSKKPALAFGFKALAWLQFTSSATVDGITGRVDLNAFYGSLNDMRNQLLGEDVMTDAQMVDLKNYIKNLFTQGEADVTVRTALWELMVRAVNATLGSGTTRSEIDKVAIGDNSPARVGIAGLTASDVVDLSAVDDATLLAEVMRRLTPSP